MSRSSCAQSHFLFLPRMRALPPGALYALLFIAGTVCLSVLCCCDKTPRPRQLKKESLFCLIFLEGRVHHGEEARRHGSKQMTWCQEQNLRAHSKHKAERTNWKRRASLSSQNPFSGTPFPQQGCISKTSPGSTTNGDQVFKHLSQYGTFSFKPPHIV